MGIYIGQKKPKSIYVGNKKVKSIYLGTSKIWSSINNLFDKNKLSSYEYTDLLYDSSGVTCIKIWNTSTKLTNSVIITEGFKENTAYSISFRDKYVSSHGYVNVTVYYSDKSSAKLLGKENSAHWSTRNLTTEANKTVTKIIFNNASNATSYSYYIDVDSLKILEIKE